MALVKTATHIVLNPTEPSTPTISVTFSPSNTLPATSTASVADPSNTPTPCKPPAKWAAYTVKAGDTLFVLSQETNLSVGQLRQANCLTSDTIRVGQPLYLPYIPTATFTPTFTPTPTPPLPTVDPTALWSPNAKRYATNSGVVVDIDQRRVATDFVNPLSLAALRWTIDSRYIIFGRKNQFNSTYTYVFDASAWKLVYGTNGCTGLSGNNTFTDYCGDYPFALSPVADRFVMENGTLVDIPTLQSIDLLAAQRPAQLLLSAGAWSPDGAYLAWVANDANQTQFALYLSRGDGSLAQLVTALDGRATTLQWLTGTLAQIVTATTTYSLDASTGKVEILSSPTPTLTASAVVTATASATASATMSATASATATP